MSYSPLEPRRVRAHAAAALVSSLLLLPACDAPEVPTAAEMDELGAMELAAGVLPASPTNRLADDAAAAALGRTLFFDRGMSSDGTVACADCHDPAGGFSDTRAVSEGVEGRVGARHSMPITSAALQPFLLWDGRADTVWRQPLLAIENEREMNLTRVEVAHFVASSHRDAYEAVFGPLPDLSAAPARGLPGDPAFDGLPPETRDGIHRVFTDVGKALEAYERQLVCAETRFDRWVRGEEDLTEDELDGAALFVRNGCTNCHSGAAFSDGGFHNLGLSPEDVEDVDLGREAAIDALLADPLNAAGSFSDDPAFGAAHLATTADETGIRGAFRTASLRGVGQRARFGHRGEHTDLAAFIDDTYNRRGRGRGGDGDGRGDRDGNIVGTLDPLLDGVNAGGDVPDRIATFLRTLDCPELPAELLAP